MNQEFPEEENPIEEIPTKRPQGRPKGYSPKNKKRIVDAPPLTPDGSDGYIYDPDAPQGIGSGKSGGGKLGKFAMPPSVMQIGAIALIVSIIAVFVITSIVTPMVGKKVYESDITRLELDLVNVRGAGYTAGMSLAGMSEKISSLSSRINSSLVQGDLDNYYTRGSVDSLISSVRSSIPSSTDLANQASSQVTTKLATVDTKLATVDTKLASVDTKMAAVDAKVAALGNSSPLEFRLVGTAPDFLLYVKSAVAGKYAAHVILNYPAPIALVGGNMTDAITDFYTKLIYPNRSFIPSLIYSSGWKIAKVEFYTPSFLLAAGVERTFTMSVTGLQMFGIQEVYIEIIKSCETTTTTGGGSI